MKLEIDPELEAVLKDAATRLGTTPEAFALRVLHETLVPPPPPFEPRDDWERRVLAAATDCGTSLSNEALSREEMYD